MARFGCPRKIVTDNAQAFKILTILYFYSKYHINLGHSTPYYPQGNGLVGSFNKRLIMLIKKMLFDHKKYWDSKLKYALWVDMISTKNSIGTSPF